MRVLVTRPEPGASATAGRLEELGHESIIVPLTEIVALEPALTDDLTGFDAVAVTSANAIRHAPPEITGSLREKPWFAVGAQTAEAARAAGRSRVTSADADAEALAGLIASRQKPGARIAYLCGKVRLPGFEAALSAKGFRVEPVETYDTIARPWTVPDVRQAMENRRVDAALVYSVLAARPLSVLANSAELEDLFADTVFLCLSPRIADALAPLPAARVRSAPEPTDTALLSLLGLG